MSEVNCSLRHAIHEIECIQIVKAVHDINIELGVKSFVQLEALDYLEFHQISDLDCVRSSKLGDEGLYYIIFNKRTQGRQMVAIKTYQQEDTVELEEACTTEEFAAKYLDALQRPLADKLYAQALELSGGPEHKRRTVIVLGQMKYWVGSKGRKSKGGHKTWDVSCYWDIGITGCVGAPTDYWANLDVQDPVPEAPPFNWFDEIAVAALKHQSTGGIW